MEDLARMELVLEIQRLTDKFKKLLPVSLPSEDVLLLSPMVEQGGSTQPKIYLNKNDCVRKFVVRSDLVDYARKLHNPENRNSYELEIAAMEEECGSIVSSFLPSSCRSWAWP